MKIAGGKGILVDETSRGTGGRGGGGALCVETWGLEREGGKEGLVAGNRVRFA